MIRNHLLLGTVLVSLLLAGCGQKSAQAPFTYDWSLPKSPAARDDLAVSLCFREKEGPVKTLTGAVLLAGPIALKEAGPLSWSNLAVDQPACTTLHLQATAEGRAKIAIKLNYERTDAHQGSLAPQLDLMVSADGVYLADERHQNAYILYLDDLLARGQITPDEHKQRQLHPPAVPPVEGAK